MLIKHITIFSCESKDDILNKILTALEANTDVKYILKLIRARNDKAEESLSKQFLLSDYIIFISSTGIATRYIGKLLKDKYTDPGVVVVDTLGKFCISLASGHVGGANDMTKLLASSIGATPVITTASDINNSFAIDEFARQNDLVIHNPKAVKHMTINIMQREAVGIVGKCNGLEEKLRIELEKAHCKTDNPYPKNIIQIVNESEDILQYDNISSIILKPKNLYVGIGCRKGTPFYKIYDFLNSIFESSGLDKERINSIASIELKDDEAGIVQLARTLSAKFVCYSSEELSNVTGDFEESNFVMDTVGVGNVCERSAAAACLEGTDLTALDHSLPQKIVSKTIGAGITIAVYKK